MRTNTARTFLAAAVAVLCLNAAPVAAEIFHIELTNGNVFDTRYRPEEASWDSSLVLFMNDSGNWMAIPKAEIAGITAETENKGFGMVINTTTIMLGYSANDAPLPEEEARFAEIERMQQLFQGQQQDYSVEQFVEPSQAGGTTGGLPAYGATAPPEWTYYGNLGAPPVQAPALAPIAPAAPAPAAPPPSPGIE